MNSNKYKYSCPHCSSVLTNKGTINFKIKHLEEYHDIFVCAEIGNYEYKLSPGIKIAKGKLLNFHCPDCNANLKSKKYGQFASVQMMVTESIEFEVLFSRKAGVRATYIITQDGVEKYGHDKHVLEF